MLNERLNKNKIQCLRLTPRILFVDVLIDSTDALAG